MAQKVEDTERDKKNLLYASHKFSHKEDIKSIGHGVKVLGKEN